MLDGQPFDQPTKNPHKAGFLVEISILKAGEPLLPNGQPP